MSVPQLKVAAQVVIDRWADGDLAYAVNQLEAELNHAESTAYRNDLVAQIEQKWLDRAAAQDLGKPSSMKYRRAELEFFSGAMATLQVVFGEDDNKLTNMVPPRWVIDIVRGQNIVKPKGG